MPIFKQGQTARLLADDKVPEVGAKPPDKVQGIKSFRKYLIKKQEHFIESTVKRHLGKPEIILTIQHVKV